MARNTRKKRIVIKDSEKFKKSVFILLLIIILCILIYNSKTIINLIKNNSNNVSIPVSEKDSTTLDTQNINTKKEQKDITFNMSVIGDIMCHNTQYTDAYNSNTDTYDFSYVFKDIKAKIKTADIAVGNLETTFAGKSVGYSSYPTFNTPESLADNLKDLGLDVLTTANNHSLDKGYKGIESTIDYLDKADISHTGTFKSEEDQNKILIKNVKDAKIAFLSYTYGTNGIKVPTGKDYCINLIDKELIKKQLELAKAENPDIICVSMHWGIEYQTKQNKEQEALADFLFENGVDIILGSHPHVLQPMEKRTVTLEDGSTKDGFVIYSLGNFMSGQVKENTKNSIILDLKITKKAKDGKISIDSVNYTPIYMYKSTAKTKAYKILDIENSISKYDLDQDTSIGQKTYNTLQTELTKIKNTMGEPIK